MRGHWLSQTRRLNRHYQSGGLLPPLEWWLGIVVAGFGPNAMYQGNLNGLTFRSDGCYVGNAQYGGSLIIPSKPIGTSTFASFVPFMIMDLSPITLNGYSIPDLLQYTLTDSTNKLKLIKTNVTFYWFDVLGVEQNLTRSCYVFGYDVADMPTTQTGFGQVQISDAKFGDLKWHLDKGSPLQCRVNSHDFDVTWYDSQYNVQKTGCNADFRRDLIQEFPDMSDGFNAPEIGSSLNFDDSLILTPNIDTFTFYSNTLGSCHFGYIDENSNQVLQSSVFTPIGENGRAEFNIGAFSGYPVSSSQQIKCVSNEFSCDYGFLDLSMDTTTAYGIEQTINNMIVVGNN